MLELYFSNVAYLYILEIFIGIFFLDKVFQHSRESWLIKINIVNSKLFEQLCYECSLP